MLIRLVRPDRGPPLRFQRDIRDAVKQSSLLCRKGIRRGTFNSVEQLIQAINDYIETHNQQPNAFVWTASAEKIFAKVRRAREVLDKVRSVRDTTQASRFNFAAAVVVFVSAFVIWSFVI